MAQRGARRADEAKRDIEQAPSECKRYRIESNAGCPRLTPALISSGALVQWRGGFGVGLRQEAVDGGLEGDEEWNTPRLRRRLVNVAKKPSTALTHEVEVGVKWKVQRGCRVSHSVTFG